jgi:hypothetical protein
LRQALAISAVTLCLVSCGLFFPFGRDQGNYAYPAWAWLDGQMPYRDVYVFKPPATVWVHALAQLLFGHSMLAVRILDLGWTVATALCITAIARRWMRSELAPALSGMLYAFLYANFDFWNTCQTDGWFNLPLAGAILLATRVWTGESHERVLLPAGALFGLAFTFKYTAVTMALPIGAVLLTAAVRDRQPWALVRRSSLGLLGAAALLGATAAWLWWNGAMPAFLDSQLGLVPQYVARTGKTTDAAGVFGMIYEKASTLLELEYVFAAALAGLVAVALRVRGDRRLLFVVAWWLAGMASTIVQNKFFRYHFLSSLPGAAMLGGFAAAELIALVYRWSRGGGWVVAAAMAAGLIWPSHFPRRWQVAADIVAGNETLEGYWGRRGFDINMMSVSDVMACAARIDALTSPGERVFIWGFDPVINYVAQRKTVSRFLYNYPFAVSWGNPSYESELLSALQDDPPALFIVASKDATPHATGNPADSRELFEAFTGLRTFVETRYGPPEAVHRYTIYQRKR